MPAARPSPQAGRFAGLAPGTARARLRRRCSGAARPPRRGGCGAVRPSGPVGGTPASLASPATPAAQAVPRGSAYALAARRSGAAALAASSGQAGPRPAACGLAPAGARNLYRRAHWRRKRRLLAHSRAAGRGERRLRAGVPAVAPAGKAKASPAQGGKSRPQAGALPAGAPASEGKTWRVSRPQAGSRPSLILVKRWCFYVCCCLSYLCFWPGLVAGLPVWRCVWLVAVPACSVALALCSGGGFCLFGLCFFLSRLFLACRCAGRSAGGGAVQIKSPHRVTSPVRGFSQHQRCRPQKTARQKATAHGL